MNRTTTGLCLFASCLAMAVDQSAIDQLDYRGVDLGPLGVWGRTQYGTDHILVGSVETGFAGAEGGLRKNDVITAVKVNDTDVLFRDFPPELEGDINGGAGPREVIGNAIDDALATSSRQVTFKVQRPENFEFYTDGSTKKVTLAGGSLVDLVVTLPKMPSLKQSWPFNPDKNATATIGAVTEELCDYIAEKIANGAHLGGNNCITWGSWGMTALISSGNPKYHNAIRTVANDLMDRCSDERYTNWTISTSTWHFPYIGYALCEYYAATGDTRAIAAIKNVMRVTCRTTAVKSGTRGHHGHGYRQNHGYAYFDPATVGGNWNAGLNAVTTTIYASMTFAHYQLGINLDDEATEIARYTDALYTDGLWSYDLEKTIGALRYHLGRSLGRSSNTVNGTRIDSWHTGYYDGSSEWDAGMRGPQHAAGLIFENSTWLNKAFSTYPDMDGDGNLDASSRADQANTNLLQRRAGAIRFSSMKPGMALSCHAQTQPGMYWAAQVTRWGTTNATNSALVEADITETDKANSEVFAVKRIDNGYEQFMNFYRWWLTLSRAPQGYKEKFNRVAFFQGGKGNTGGDGYLGLDNNAHTIPASMLAAYTGKLQVHGNSERNWYKCGDTENFVSIDIYDKNKTSVPLAATVVTSGTDATLTYTAPAGKKIISVTASNGKTYSLPTAPATSVTITEAALTASFDVSIEMINSYEPKNSYSCGFEVADGFIANQTLYGGELLTDAQGAKWTPVTLADHNGSNKVVAKMWWGLSGSVTTDLTNNSRYPNQFSTVQVMDSLGYSSIGDNYASSITGYLIPPSTGSYTFYINSDDSSQLWLSTDMSEANAVQVGAVNGYRSSWLQGSTVNLIAGQKYFLRTLHKEGGGGDHFYAGWKVPGSSTIVTIPGTNFESIVPYNGGIACPSLSNCINGTKGLNIPTGAVMSLELPNKAIGQLSMVVKSGDANNYAFGFKIYLGSKVTTPVVNRSSLNLLYSETIQSEKNVLIPVNLSAEQMVNQCFYFETTNISGSSYAGLQLDNIKTLEYDPAVVAVSVDMAGKGSIVLGQSLQFVPVGADAQIPTVKANTGYIFTGWDQSFNQVTANRVITAQYQMITSQVRFEAGNHGVFSAGNTQQVVNYGQSAVAPTLVVDQGWRFTAWSQALTNITGDCVIKALYTADMFSINIQDANGTVIDSSVIETGSSFTKTIWPSSDGVAISAITINGVSQTINSNERFGPYQLNINNVTANQTVVVTFSNTRRDDSATNTVMNCSFESSENFPAVETTPVIDATITDDESTIWTFNGSSTLKVNSYVTSVGALQLPVNGYVIITPANLTEGISDLNYNLRAYTGSAAYDIIWEVGSTANGWQEIARHSSVYSSTKRNVTANLNLSASSLVGKSLRASVILTGGTRTEGIYIDDVIAYKIDSTPTGSYAVVFDAGKLGTITSGNAYQEVVAGSSAVAPVITALDAQKPFASWDKDFSIVNNNMVVRAVYTNSTHQVNFVLGSQGQLINATDSLTVSVADGVAVVPPQVQGITQSDANGRIIGGYEFVAWDKPLHAVTGNLTVNAIYRPVRLPVVVSVVGAGLFSANGITYDVNNTTFLADSDTDFNFTVEPLSGYQIQSITTTNGQSRVPSNPMVTYTTKVTVAPSMNLNVVFAPISKAKDYVVVFDLGQNATRNGGGELVQYLNLGEAAQAPTLSVNSAYTFSHWSYNFSNVQGDLLVKAVYTPVTYRIEFVIATADQSKAIFSDRNLIVQQVRPGENAIAPSLYIKDKAYRLSHWDTNYYQVNNNLTVTAVIVDLATDLAPIFSQMPHTYPVNSGSVWSGTVVISDATQVNLSLSVPWLSVSRVSGNTFNISGSMPWASGDQNYSVIMSAIDATAKTTKASFILEVIDINDAPVAVVDQAYTDENKAVTIAVLANDSDAQGDTLTLQSITQATSGSVTINGNSVIYTPNASFVGNDSFTYTVSDGLENATATVNVTVRGLKTYWKLNEGSGTTSVDEIKKITATITGATWSQGIQNKGLTFDGVNDKVVIPASTALSGTIDFTVATWVKTSSITTGVIIQQRDSSGSGYNGQWQLRMNNNGTLSFYVYRDGAFQFTCNTTATINNGQWHHVIASRQGAVGKIYIDGIEVSSVTGSAAKSLNSALQLGIGCDIRDSISYFAGVLDEIRIYERSLTTAEMNELAIVPNRAPVAVNDNVTLAEDTSLSVAVLANDSDADGQVPTVTTISQATHGSVAINGNEILYTPVANYFGNDAFTYTITDGTEVATATVNVTVNSVNDAPQASNDTASVVEDNSLTIDLLGNDSDLEADALTISVVTQGTNGAVIIVNNQVSYTPVANFNGNDSFTYTMTDGTDTATATVNVSVTAVNDAPQANNDIATVNEDGTITIGVLTNDIDVDADTLSVTTVTQGAHGAVSLVSNQVSYTPVANFNGNDSFTYTITDGALVATATVNITVTAVNDAPQAVNDSVVVNSGEASSLLLLSNDTDTDGDILTIQSVTTPANGSVQISGSSVIYTSSATYTGTDSFSYTISDGQATATATVQVKVVGLVASYRLNSDSGTSLIDEQGRYPLTANGGIWSQGVQGKSLNLNGTTEHALSSSSVNLGTQFTISAWINSELLSGDRTIIAQDNIFAFKTYGTGFRFTTPAIKDHQISDAGLTTNTWFHVAVTFNEGAADGCKLYKNGTLVTTIAASQISEGAQTLKLGSSQWANQFFDGSIDEVRIYNKVLSAAEIATLAVNPNRAPIATNDVAETLRDQSVSVAVLTNDSDADSDVLTIESTTNPLHGTVVINGNSIDYTPTATYFGSDNFTYTINDGHGASQSATVNINVIHVNYLPVANNDTANTAEDTAVTVTALANDSDADGEILSITAVTQGAHGNVTIVNNQISYVPVANFYGNDTFTYTITDGTDTANATVNVTVNSVNDAPQASNDTASVLEDNSLTINVLGNDSDLEADALTISAVTQGTNGAVNIVNNQVSYTPVANFNGNDTFTYTMTDGTDTATATVNVSVTAVNDAPQANNDTATVNEDGTIMIGVLTNDTDVDGALTITAVTQGAHGAVTILGNQVTYTPVAQYFGNDSFTYTITDGAIVATASVNVTVNSVNDAPQASNDTAIVLEDNSLTINVLGNDSDLEADALTISVVTQGTNGAVNIVNNQVSYTPVANFNGNDTFTYTITDGALVATATVNVTVTAVNDAPQANNDTATVNEDGTIMIGVLTNDIDVDADTLSITAVTQGAHGAVTILGNQVTYTPVAEYFGVDSFTYTITDGALAVTATVHVNVTSVNDAPQATEDIGFTLAEQAVTLNVLTNDNDPENDTLTIESVTQGTKGSVDIVSNQLIYTPLATFTVSDTFTYTVTDGQGGSTTAQVKIYDTKINIDFEASQGFPSLSSGATKAIGTVQDIYGTTWYSANGAYLWNRSDIPTSGVQCLTLSGNQSCQFQTALVYNGIASITFNYASFSASTNTTFNVWYDRLDGNGWQSAWSKTVKGLTPDWRVKPWPFITLPLNLNGPVIILFQTTGTKGVLIDQIKITPNN